MALEQPPMQQLMMFSNASKALNAKEDSATFSAGANDRDEHAVGATTKAPIWGNMTRERERRKKRKLEIALAKTKQGAPRKSILVGSFGTGDGTGSVWDSPTSSKGRHSSTSATLHGSLVSSSPNISRVNAGLFMEQPIPCEAVCGLKWGRKMESSLTAILIAWLLFGLRWISGPR